MAPKPVLGTAKNSEENQQVDKNILHLAGGDGTGNSMEARVAVLEQIAKDTKEVLNDIKAELRELRSDMKTELREIRSTQKTDFLWTLSAIAGLFALMAHGFHWF